MQNKPRLDRAACMLDPGQSISLSIIGNKKGDQYTFTSGDSSIVNVNQNGQIEAKSCGETIVTACSDTDTLSCLVTVGFPSQNPYLPPSWNLFIADGEPHVFDGKMYIYGSRDCPNGFLDETVKKDWCSPDYHVIWSDDLLHWTDAGKAISVEDIPPEIRGTGNRLWAPDIFKSPKDNKYYFLFCTNGANVFIADSEEPTGPFGNIRRITLGQQELCTIDPAALVDDDGTVYIALPGDFFIAKLDPEDYSRIIPESKIDLKPLIEEADEEYFPFEGPSLRKHNGLYYYVYISSRKGEFVPTQMSYLVSCDPMDISSWRHVGSFINTRGFIKAGNVHGGFEEFGGKHFLSYHTMARGFEKFTRTMNLDELKFNTDGAIQPVIRTSSGAKGCFSAGETVLAASAIGFENGREDDRFIRLSEDDSENQVLFHSAVVSLQSGLWVLYRYFAFLENAKKASIRYKCQKESVLQIEALNGDNTCATKVHLPASNQWQTFDADIFLPSGQWEIRLSLEQALDDQSTFLLSQFSLG